MVVAQGFCLVAMSRGYSLAEVVWASHSGGFSCCRAQAPGPLASAVMALGS